MEATRPIDANIPNKIRIEIFFYPSLMKTTVLTTVKHAHDWKILRGT